MSLTYVSNVFSGGNSDSNYSIFPTMMDQGTITFLAHFPLDVNINTITSYSKLTLYPVHLRNTYCVNSFDDLAQKNCFVFLCVNEKLSSISVYLPNISETIEFKGDLEVVLRNDVVGDGRGESKLVFPNRNGVLFRVLNEKFDRALKFISKDYLEFIRAEFTHSPEPQLKALKQKIRIDSFPKNLVRVESIARPIVTPAAAGSSRPAVSSPEKKSFFSKLFS